MEHKIVMYMGRGARRRDSERKGSAIFVILDAFASERVKEEFSDSSGAAEPCRKVHMEKDERTDVRAGSPAAMIERK